MKKFKKFISFLLALSLVLTSMQTHASVALLAAPLGWLAKSGTYGAFRYGQAANQASFRGGTVLTNASLDVGGKLITVPVAQRVAANAAMFVATAVTLNPATLGVLALAWIASNCIVYSSGTFTITCGNKDVSTSTGYYSYAKVNKSSTPDSENNIDNWGLTYQETCLKAEARANAVDPTYRYEFSRKSGANCVGKMWRKSDEFQYSGSSYTYAIFRSSDPVNQNRFSSDCPSGSYVINGQCTSEYPDAPIPPERVITELSSKPLPDNILSEFPDLEVPLERPTINYDPSISPAAYPATSPYSSRPFWVPVGDPYPNTQAEGQPQTWTQPGYRVNHSPSADKPWRVDLVDAPITKNDPNPNSDPYFPTTNNQGNPSTPVTVNLETCGLPGKSACLLDETGTPQDREEAETFAEPLEQLDTTEDVAKQAITAAADTSSPVWSFAFALPTGCTPFDTGIQDITLDICQFQDTIHDLLSMVWVAATAFGLIGMVGRTIRES
jgi:hypothetical protein